MLVRPNQRASAVPRRLHAGLLTLGLLSAVACSSGGAGACPQYLVADSVTIDASAFFATHATAFELCVSGARCVVRRPGLNNMGTDVLSGGLSAITLRIRILTRKNTKLIDKTVRVRLHQVAYGAATCTNTALRGSVAVTARGALSVS